jgi:hypothetical protein
MDALNLKIGSVIRVFDRDGSVVGAVESLERNEHSICAKIRSTVSGRTSWVNVYSDGTTCEQSRWEFV